MSARISMSFILIFVTSFLSAMALTPLATWIGLRTGAVDQPSPRRIHHKPTARLGGLAIFLAFLVGVYFSVSFPRTDPFEPERIKGLLIGCALMFLIGLVDDYHELKSVPQLIAQVVAAFIAIASGVLIIEIPNPFGGALPLYFQEWFGILFTLFWLVGMVNTINWLDGMDGLAAGVSVIAGGVMFLHTFGLRQYSISLLVLALIGAALGFLLFNFSPARIFMGSIGSNVLGFALGVLSIIGGAKVATALLVLGVPILDVAWQIITRLRAGKSPFVADRGHLHHRLLDLGLSQRTIVILYYALSAFFGVLALILPSGVYKLIALVVIGAGALLVLIRLGHETVDRR
ncbi:MAG: undecaprenyl/decaprenyl-phosphate alpha-N-acetylglucosaminyl 1-phosphate transferase [Chloroflexi bacterium]|nr:undecaprenyl/decaprenyl-phosphate alpha-N-acetylglucosaminyl 1-phosphate transferase [Chloroflexota bacterium]